MTEQELEQLRRELIAQRERLTAQLRYMEQSLRHHVLREAGGELAGYSMHPADAGTDHGEREKAAQLTSSERRLLASIDEALARIDAGGYGACADCGGPIGIRRLLAMPDAVRCIACQEKADRAVMEGGS